MQPLYTEEEFKNATSRQPLPLQCKSCLKTFRKTKNRIQEAIRPDRSETYDFCSHRCRSLYHHPPMIVNCEQCQKPFSKEPRDIEKTKHHFCCQSCSAKWFNAHKIKGSRISKLERWLQEQLPAIYPALEFYFNRTDAINAELDIFIPSLRLAFELNGIFHYEPIYGPEKLAKMQTNDTRKMLACAEHGIELCVIDNSSMKNFKPIKAQKFLDIIKGIIESKLSWTPPVIS
jgi:hypothetical protein